MKLVLQNSYPLPFPITASESVSDALGEAVTHLVLENVVQFQILHTMTVQFTGQAARDLAMTQTGWKVWDNDTLEAELATAEGYVMPGIVVNKAYELSTFCKSINADVVVQTVQTVYAGFVTFAW